MPKAACPETRISRGTADTLLNIVRKYFTQ